MPRTRRKKNKKDFRHDDGQSRPVSLCHPCHKRVHLLPLQEAEHYF
jgi:hypothetical protein